MTPSVIGQNEDPSSVLTWSAVTGATGYRVYRSAVSSSSGFVQVADVSPGPGYTDPVLGAPSHGQTYWWKVAALSGTSVGPESSVVSAQMVHGFIAPLPASITFYDGEGDQDFEFSSYLSSQDVPITASDSLPASLSLPDVEPPVLRFTDGAGSDVVAVTRTFRVGSSAEADWISRSTGPGVVWAHDFRSPEEVDLFYYWSGSDGWRNTWLTGDQRPAGTTGAFDIPSDIRAAYPEGDGIPGTGGGSVNIHLRVGDTVGGRWMRPFNAFTGATNGRGIDDPASGVNRIAWDTATTGYSSSRDRIRTWKRGYYSHPDNWRLPNGSPCPLRAASDGFELEPTTDGSTTDEFWIQFRYKVPAARFGPNEPNGKLLFINKMSVGSQLAGSSEGQIIVESNGNYTGDSPGFPGLFAYLNEKVSNFGQMTETQGQIPSTSPEQPGGATYPNPDATYCAYPYNATKCGSQVGLIMSDYADQWVTIMVHVKVGHRAMYGYRVSEYTQLSSETKAALASAGIEYADMTGRAPDLRRGRTDAFGDQIYAIGNDDSTFEMWFAPYGASAWTPVYSKSDYVFCWGSDYRIVGGVPVNDGNVAQGGRGFQSIQLAAYMNSGGTTSVGASDAPWFQRFTQIIFSRQAIPLPAPGA